MILNCIPHGLCHFQVRGGGGGVILAQYLMAFENMSMAPDYHHPTVDPVKIRFKYKPCDGDDKDPLTLWIRLWKSVTK